MFQQTPVKAVFTDAADLSKLSADKLYLDDAVQQAGIRVCVDGASSYSLTSTSARRHAAAAPPQAAVANGLPHVSGSAFTAQRVIKESVVADRPFAYALYSITDGVVYAAGRLDRPVWEDAEDDGNDNGNDGGSNVETVDVQ